jgi:hypothetical protein
MQLSVELVRMSQIVRSALQLSYQPVMSANVTLQNSKIPHRTLCI